MNPDELDERLEQLYNSAQTASSEGLTEEAVRRCEEALSLLESYGEDTEQHNYADFVMLMGDIHWSAGSYEDAYRAYHRVVQNEPERPDARIAMGVALFHLCRFTAAQTVLEMCSLDTPEDAETWYYLGLLALRQRRTVIAWGLLEKAHEIEEDRFFMPEEISDDELRTVHHRMILRLPPPFRHILEQVPVAFEDQPSDDVLFSSDPPMDPTILGIFDGVPVGENELSPNTAIITQVIYYRENIWLLNHDRKELEDELWTTVRHELGHFLGLSEEEMDEQGLD